MTEATEEVKDGAVSTEKETVKEEAKPEKKPGSSG